MKKSIKFFTNLNDPLDQLRINDLFIVTTPTKHLGVYSPTISNLSAYHTVKDLVSSGNVEIISKIITYNYFQASEHLEIDLGFDTSKP